MMTGCLGKKGDGRVCRLERITIYKSEKFSAEWMSSGALLCFFFKIFFSFIGQTCLRHRCKDYNGSLLGTVNFYNPKARRVFLLLRLFARVDGTDYTPPGSGGLYYILKGPADGCTELVAIHLRISVKQRLLY